MSTCNRVQAHPFILRGVTLVGIDSVRSPLSVRERAWQRLSTNLDLEKLSTISVVGRADVDAAARDLLSGCGDGHWSPSVANGPSEHESYNTRARA